MSVINLSFIKPPAFSLNRVNFWGVILFVLGLLAAFLAWDYHQRLSIKQANIEAQLETLEAYSPKPKQQAVQTYRLPKREVKAIKQMVAVLTLPWDALFRMIEAIKHKNIALLELNPNNKKRQVVIRGEAKNLRSVFSYIRVLDASALLNNVYLQTHSVDNNNPDKPVVFTIHGSWVTDTNQITASNVSEEAVK